ncbi:MAG: hypothetical protein IKP40_07950 [Clostridia bacterium]|nr:hypothetical protein [Clostridia bacterium]
MRQADPKSISWTDKTMTMLQARQHEARFQRVSAFPRFGLFDDVTDAQAEMLYLISYEGSARLNAPVLHTVEGLRSLVLERLPREALLITPPEYQVLMGLIAGGGTLSLADDYHLVGVESLVRRLWCTVRGQGEELSVTLPARLSVRLADLLTSDQAEEARNRLSVFHSGMISALNVYGAVLADSALSLLQLVCSQPGLLTDPSLCLRMLKASYPYVYNRRGQLVLTHPGLADPVQMADQAAEIDPRHLIRNPEEDEGSQMLLSDAERDAAIFMSELLAGALRPDCYPPASTEDLRILMKQGVPIPDLEQVLAAQLTVQPTPAMRDALRLMQSHTTTWLIHKPGRYH